MDAIYVPAKGFTSALIDQGQNNSMITRNLLIATVASSLFSGCATITSNEMQTVSLQTKSADGQDVDKAYCTLKNDKGSWQANTPALVAVRRSSDDLMVECKKDGVADGFLRAISRAAAGMFGNIIFGGGIGALIDHSKGTGYDYPNDLLVKMGESNTADKRQNAQQQASAAPSQEPYTAGNK